jgi:hypothetical protein
MDGRGGAQLRSAQTAELVRELVGSLSSLLEKHVALAKAEARLQLKKEARALAGIAVAGFLACLAVAMLAAGGALVLALVLPGWAAALVMAGVLSALAGVLALLGRRARARDALPQTRQTIREDVRWLKRKDPRALPSLGGVPALPQR